MIAVIIIIIIIIITTIIIMVMMMVIIITQYMAYIISIIEGRECGSTSLYRGSY